MILDIARVAIDEFSGVKLHLKTGWHLGACAYRNRFNGGCPLNAALTFWRIPVEFYEWHGM
jgi:hypothetical protein